jgi:hypothetical protein
MLLGDWEWVPRGTACGAIVSPSAGGITSAGKAAVSTPPASGEEAISSALDAVSFDGVSDPPPQAASRATRLERRRRERRRSREWMDREWTVIRERSDR